MSGCERLSDRMPAVLLSRDTWNADEEAHLAACADCGAEWALLHAARRVGAAAPRVAARHGLAEDVMWCVASAPVARPARRLPRWAAGLAAAAAVAATVWLGTQGDSPAPAAPDPVAAIAEQLEPAELDVLLDGEAAPIAGWSMLDMPGMGDLDEGELQRVLSTWEG
jgi:hypothetical protein